MRLTYENKRGKVIMFGGGGPDWNITQIRGLSIPESDISSIRYPHLAGQIVTRATATERYITISGDVRDKNRKLLSRAARVFAAPGTLYITSFSGTKKIEARCVSFEPNQSRGMFVPFTLQFCADKPFFEDLYETSVYIASKTKRLASPFVLGCVFSERVLKNNVVNRGDVECEPVFEISSVAGALCPEGIEVKNLTNGNVITLNTDVSSGEIITIDVKERKITSSQRGNILSCLAEYTSLSEFSLDVGVSSVEIAANEISGELQAVCKYNNNYVSANV